MSSIVRTKTDALKKAIRFVNDGLKDGKKKYDLIDKACQEYGLSPLEADWLIRQFKNE